MLALGLSVIYLFIRIHGDGYDFPIKVADHNSELEFSRLPDRTYVEISGNVHHDYFQDSWQDSTQDGAPNSEKDSRNHHGQKIMTGWRVGSKQSKDTAYSAEDTIESDQSWIWMTNIWHEGSECGPGHLRQYRRRLDHMLADDNPTPWELMYTHRFPGPITHSSLSRHITPSLNEDRNDGVESIRLAVVYQVSQNEQVAYHTRVYHFGIYDTRTELQECGATSSETCHAREPFVSFDYILAGSTRLKDFRLEHDTILYSRLSDTAAFRSLRLPTLKPGDTSPDRPFALNSGVPGPSLSCRERKNMPYRMSYLAKVTPNSESDTLHVMMGQVQDYTHSWDYQLSIATEATELMTGNKKWLTEQQWLRQHPSLIQENDMINDETHTYGVSIQKPFIVKSVDGSSIHIPIKDHVITLDTRRTLTPENDDSHVNSDDRRHRSQNRKPGAEHYLVPSSNFKEQWIESLIDMGSLETIDTIQGVISDATDMMALKTTRNGILVLKRDVDKSSTDGTVVTDTGTRKDKRWQLSMVLSDSLYDPAIGNMERQEVLGMKIVSVEVHEKVDESVTAGEGEGESQEHESIAKNQQNDLSGLGHVPTPAPAEGGDEESQASKTRIHNILFLVYGSGRVVAYDLNQAMELSSFVMFLRVKYPVVIGMLAVVIAFVINEAR